MLQPNTPQGTGAMTLEQGVASMKASLAAKGANVDDAVIVHTEDPNEEAAEELEVQGGQVEEEQTDPTETDAENVSEDESQEPEQEPDDRPILLPDGSKITVEEARKGYLRQADFTRKTQEVARERELLIAEKQNAANQLGALYQQLASLQETEPNWLQLSQQVEPAEYQRQQAYWTHKKNVMAQTQQQIQQAQAQALQAEKARAYQALNSGEFDPKWKDPQALKSALNTISDYWVERGLPADMLDGITNPTVIEVVEESRRYRELQKAKPKATLAVKGKPKPFVPGAKSTATPASETLRRYEEAFTRNPNVDNAVALQKARAALRR